MWHASGESNDYLFLWPKQNNYLIPSKNATKPCHFWLCSGNVFSPDFWKKSKWDLQFVQLAENCMILKKTSYKCLQGTRYVVQRMTFCILTNQKNCNTLCTPCMLILACSPSLRCLSFWSWIKSQSFLLRLASWKKCYNLIVQKRSHTGIWKICSSHSRWVKDLRCNKTMAL